MLELNKIYNMDCLDGMKLIPEKSIDMILCDLPYGTTACEWDTIIPFELLWHEYKRIIKDGRAIVLFGSEPFSSKLRQSHISGYKYDWVWDKKSVSNPQLAKKQPLKNFELISVFGKDKRSVVYYPQKLIQLECVKTQKTKVSETEGLRHIKRREDYTQEFTNYPKAILEYSRPSEAIHPTQKPTELLTYLINTYTNEHELVLDNCMGSGSTAIACIKTNRDYIGFELDNNYYKMANERIEQENSQLKLF